MKHVINLYTKPSCPKCKILKAECEKSERIKNSDFQVSEITSEDDTDYQLLFEHNIHMLPVLLVDNTFYNFDSAMMFVRGELD